MDWTWIWWRAVIPILGPVILPLIVVFLYASLEPDIKIREYFPKWRVRRIPNPTGWLYFAVTASAFSFFTMISTKEPRPWMYGTSLFLMLGCFLYHVLVSLAAYIKEEGDTYEPPAHLYFTTLLLAIAAAYVSYNTYAYIGSLIP